MLIQKNVINLVEIYNMNKKKRLPIVEITKRFGGYCFKYKSKWMAIYLNRLS